MPDPNKVPDNRDTTGKTLGVAFALCVACSVVVSTAAVLLEPLQERNRIEDRKRNILAAAGMYDPARPVAEQFERIVTKVVHLPSGRFQDDLAPEAAALGSEPDYAVVYLVGDPRRPESVILPLSGMGLWGPMKGFIALRGDFNTVAGLGYYEHKETPGLGGEVDNPRWKALWPGKLLYRESGESSESGEDGEVALSVLKGFAERGGPDWAHEVDGLSGATLTTRGIDDMLKFWLGRKGFGPFLARLQAGEI